MPYLGKQGDKSEKGLGSKIVMAFKWLLKKGQVLVCDNFFTSYNLAETLQKHGIGLIGTTRTNYSNWPEKLKLTKTQQRKMQVGDYKLLHNGKGIMAFTWSDKGLVNMIASFGTTVETFVTRRMKVTTHNVTAPSDSSTPAHAIEPSLSATPAPAPKKRGRSPKTPAPAPPALATHAQPATHDTVSPPPTTPAAHAQSSTRWVQNEVKCPTPVKLYNENMGAVDLADQMRAQYGVHFKGIKWWHKCFFYYVDSMVHNAFCIYRMNGNVKKSDKSVHRAFRLRLIHELLVAAGRAPPSADEVVSHWCAKA